MAMLTKAQQVHKYICTAIASGRWSVGEKLPGEDFLLEELEVSNTTLRHALSSLAYEGIIVRKHGSGTYVSRVPATGNVAILVKHDCVSSPMGYWYRKLVEQARARIEGSGYRAVLSVGHGDTPDAFMSSINLFDGSVLRETVGVLNTTGDGIVADRIAMEGIPSVMIDAVAVPGSHCVLMDYSKMSELAVEMLRKRGHDEFALMYIDFSEASEDGTGDQGYRELLKMLRATVGFRDDLLVPVPFTPDFEQAYERFKEWWSRPNRPKAIFFFDESLCDVASRAILELGIKVPEELAIITHAQIGRQFQFPVMLTRLGWEISEVMAAAWDMLDRLIEKEPGVESVIHIPPIVQEGESL